ncbi:MAG: flagellar assembly protein FliW [Chromatiales bacterium]|jgi:flagellar assembly factor FliW
MEYNTSGKAQNISVEKTLTFPNGIPGFEDFKEFLLLQNDGDKRLFWLRATDNGLELAVATPDTLGVNYEIKLSDDELALLEFSDNDEIVVLVTLSNTDDGSVGVHGNFLGPILINTNSRKAFQKVLNKAQGSITIKAE